MSVFRAAANLQRLQQTYEQEEKPRKVLAWKIRQLEAKRPITNFWSQGKNIIDPIEINSTLRNYFEKLCCSKIVNIQDITEYLDKLHIARIQREDGEELEKEINITEIDLAKYSIKPRKRVGPAGITIELYPNIFI